MIKVTPFTNMRKAIAVGSTALKRDYGIIAHSPKASYSDNFAGKTVTKTLKNGEESYSYALQA